MHFHLIGTFWVMSAIVITRILSAGVEENRSLTNPLSLQAFQFINFDDVPN
jgi:hypothetical protein